MSRSTDLIERYKIFVEHARERYDALGRWGKVFVVAYVGFQMAAIVAAIIITPQKIFASLAKGAIALREWPLAPFLLVAGIVVASTPPFLGYGGMVTLCGFAYGVWRGWIIACVGCLVGSAFSFTLIRRFRRYFARWLEDSPTFTLLSRAIGRKGLSLVILIRLCPFPFQISNLFFASLPPASVSLPSFLFATLCTTPKLLLHVFIGSRMFLLADEEERAKMDPMTKVANIVSIVLGTALSAGTGWWVYRLVMRESAAAGLGESGDAGDADGGDTELRSRLLDEEEDEIRREVLGDDDGVDLEAASGRARQSNS